MGKIGEPSTFQALIDLIKSKLGSAAYKDIPSSGNASTTEVVLGSDTRLTDSRTPTSHIHTVSDVTDFPTLGTAAALNVAESGNASASEVVKGDDTRLTDSRTPTSHTHAVADISDFPTLGTAAALDVAASGDASASEVVKGDDTRLTDSRTPTSHTHTMSDITDLDLSGKANNSIVAAEFDSTASYAVNDYVMHNGVFYKCTTAHTGAWDANDFTATLISDEFGSGGEEEEAVYRYNFVTKSVSGTDATVTVNKYVNDVLESSTDYLFTDIRVTPVNIDGRFTFVYQTGAYKYLLTWLQSSVEHDAGYSESWRYDESVDFSNTFIVSNKDISYVAPWFTASASYAIGDLVTREEKLYKCTTAHTGAWNDAHFTETTVDAELDNKVSKTGDTMTGGLNIIGETTLLYSGTVTSTGGGILINNGPNIVITVGGVEVYSGGNLNQYPVYLDMAGSFHSIAYTKVLGIEPPAGQSFIAKVYKPNEIVNLNVSGEIKDGKDNVLSNKIDASAVPSWAKQSSKPSYTASEVGAVAVDAGFAHTDDITYNPDTKTVTCSKSGASNWDSSIYSKSGYFDNVFVTFKPVDKNMYFMIGLNANPSASVAFTDIDYCWFCQGGGSLYIFESGTQVTPPAGHTTYSAGDELRIEYSNGFISYYHNGELVRSVARAIGDPLYLDSSFYNSGSVYDVEFGAGLGSTNVIDQPTLTDAFTVSSIATLGNTGFVQKQGNIVSIYINLNSTSSGTFGDIGVLASKYRPKTQLYTVAYDYQAKKAVGAWIDSSTGTVRIYEYESGHEYTISATYFSAT